jgi:predicted phosphodiesterase
VTAPAAGRLGLLGDIHADDARLAAALALFEGEGVDRVLFVGDVVDGEGDVDRCCALLVKAGALGVRGNHDRWLLEDRMRTLPHAHVRGMLAPASIDLLSALPPSREVATARGALLLCHGVGESDMVRLSPHDDGYALESNDDLRRLLEAPPAAGIVVGGHTHERMVRRLRAADVHMTGDASLVFVNAGAVGQTGAPCCAVLDVVAGVRFFDLADPNAPAPGELIALP